MSIFLNTEKLNHWIPKLINETKRELVIIVPYIKTSDRVFLPLQNANERGVETSLVYRENKLSLQEKAKLQSLDNINLFHHPNVHCKCFYNEEYLIITSMNMYEYSENNNREMGILLHRSEIKEDKLIQCDDAKLFEDAINEINTIINGATLEKESRETIELGFEMDIIKSAREKMLERCSLLNKAFVHKRFEPKLIDGNWECQCENYFDKIKLVVSHRAVLKLMMDEILVESIFHKFKKFYNEFMIADFKLYWNHQKSDIYLYRGNSDVWNDKTELEDFKFMKKGIDQLITELRKAF